MMTTIFSADSFRLHRRRTGLLRRLIGPLHHLIDLRHPRTDLRPPPLSAVRILEKHAVGRAAASGGVIRPVGTNAGIQAAHLHPRHTDPHHLHHTGHRRRLIGLLLHHHRRLIGLRPPLQPRRCQPKLRQSELRFSVRLVTTLNLELAMDLV